MKRLVFGLMFIGLGIFTFQHFSEAENQEDDALTQKINKQWEEDTFDNEVRSMVNKAKSLEDLERAEAKMATLPKDNRERILPVLLLKKSAFLFEQAEDYLRKAIEIENAVAGLNPPPMPPMPPAGDPEAHAEHIPPPDQQPPQREFHPLTVVNLQRAFNLYEKARKTAEPLKDIGDADFDYQMNYLKGEIYYRILELMSDPESAQELFNQTLTYYKYALRSKNNDINTVVNIELLIKNQSGLVGNAGNPQARKKQMLNSKKYGIGKSSGN